MSEPFFPPPGAPKGREPYREPERASVGDAPPAKRTVVQRAEPPKQEEEPGKGSTKLSREEVSALLATTAATSSSAARCGRRAAVVVVPVGLIRWGLVLALGESAPLAATILSAVCGLAALAWVAAPLWKQKREGWS